MTVDPVTNQKYLRVHIKTVSDKATIKLNGSSARYVGETDLPDDDVVGILIPVNDGDVEKIIPFTVTAEDTRFTSSNELRVTIQSISTDVDYVQVNGSTAFGPFTDESTGIRYFNGFIPQTVYEAAVNDGSKTTVVVQAKNHTNEEHNKTIAALMNDADPALRNTIFNTTYAPYLVSHQYLLDEVDYMENEMPQVITFSITSEAGTTEEYELRVYLANGKNNDVEPIDKENHIDKVWVGVIGTLDHIDPAEYDENAVDTYIAGIEAGITSIEMRVVADSEYAGIDIKDPITGQYSSNYVLKTKTVQITHLEPDRGYELHFRIRTQDEMLSGVGEGREYTVRLERRSNNRNLKEITAYPYGSQIQTNTDITTDKPVVIIRTGSYSRRVRNGSHRLNNRRREHSFREQHT